MDVKPRECLGVAAHWLDRVHRITGSGHWREARRGFAVLCTIQLRCDWTTDWVFRKRESILLPNPGEDLWWSCRGPHWL